LRERSHKSCYNLDSRKPLHTTFGGNGFVTKYHVAQNLDEDLAHGHSEIFSADHH
jgi:hypothetical protein